MRGLIVALALAVTGQPVLAADPVLLHAAGSLRGALTEVAQAFEAGGGTKVAQVYRPSGLIRDAIAGGERAEVFASANMAHPQSLASGGKAGPVVLFARNELCAFVRPGLEVTSANLLDRMLDPAVKLGTSTPRADPAGDYAYQVFVRAEAVRRGSRAALEGKALNLTGRSNSAPVPAGRNTYGHVIAEGKADLFLAYCTNAGPIAREQPGIRAVPLPAELAVGADYGLTVMNEASPAAYRLALMILSPAGQRILAKHGFAAPGLPRE
ncbi:MAG: molybdate ABC transporter substrate-binding protein [Phreatobacter sp.]|uniref:molybdate ABC transporter substrate-binding protein n=1 Tax=Phreatobacter sp. TaxID=1966341 RepID=UPI001A579472|nr:molybdate ABC transporter substrate-binding protein [Phreatobacter sp.]MBL8569461.1 molybdate ABC transporter substrate-binding protein [Phreatobacter sp.]